MKSRTSLPICFERNSEETPSLAQQLFGKTKTIFGKELVYVKVSAFETFKFLWLIDGKQRAVFFQETHLLPKWAFDNMLYSSANFFSRIASSAFFSSSERFIYHP